MRGRPPEPGLLLYLHIVSGVLGVSSSPKAKPCAARETPIGPRRFPRSSGGLPPALLNTPPASQSTPQCPNLTSAEDVCAPKTLSRKSCSLRAQQLQEIDLYRQLFAQVPYSQQTAALFDLLAALGVPVWWYPVCPPHSHRAGRSAMVTHSKFVSVMSSSPLDSTSMRLHQRYKTFSSKAQYQMVLSTLHKLQESGFYWGAINGKEANVMLASEPTGTFLVRDSSDNRHLFTLSVKTASGTKNLRIQIDSSSFFLQTDPKNVLSVPHFDCFSEHEESPIPAIVAMPVYNSTTAGRHGDVVNELQMPDMGASPEASSESPKSN
uniref:SH2 domain-containing protein n=1 Tax=Knipowitschia caucasica TaxID=637954 RepID=A0AAV2KI76_KNICA